MVSKTNSLPELLPKKKKKFLQLFESNENSKKIENYIKTKKIKLDKEEDLIKLFTYINVLT